VNSRNSREDVSLEVLVYKTVQGIQVVCPSWFRIDPELAKGGRNLDLKHPCGARKIVIFLDHFNLSMPSKMFEPCIFERKAMLTQVSVEDRSADPESCRFGAVTAE
jgi:hypothetical protein